MRGKKSGPITVEFYGGPEDGKRVVLDQVPSDRITWTYREARDGGLWMERHLYVRGDDVGPDHWVYDHSGVFNGFAEDQEDR